MSGDRDEPKETDERGESEVFLAPLFRGGRFDNHLLILDVAPDLLAYKQLVVELARHLYKERTGAPRVPKGFEESFQLGIKEIRVGSSAQPLIERPGALPDGLFANGVDTYLEARDELGHLVREISAGRPLPPRFPKKLVKHFNKIGSGLRDNEYIELRAPGDAVGARYDRKVREQIVLPVEGRLEDEIDLVGVLQGGLRDKGQLRLQLSNGVTVDVSYSLADVTEVVQQFTGHAIRVRGLAEFDSSHTILRITKVDELAPIADPQMGARAEIAASIAEIAALDDHWCGEGSPVFEPTRLEKIESVLVFLQMRRGLPRPFIGPTPDGEVHAEWPIGDVSLTASFDPASGMVYVHALNLANDKCLDRELPYSNEDDVTRLSDFIIELLVEENSVEERTND